MREKERPSYISGPHSLTTHGKTVIRVIPEQRETEKGKRGDMKEISMHNLACPTVYTATAHENMKHDQLHIQPGCKAAFNPP